MKKLALAIASTALLAVSAASFASVSTTVTPSKMDLAGKQVYIKNMTGETVDIMANGQEVTHLPSWDGYWMGKYTAGTYLFLGEQSHNNIGEFVLMSKSFNAENIMPIDQNYSVKQDTSAYADHPQILAIDITKK